MTVKFYQNASDDRRVNKTITLKKTLSTVVVKEDSSIIKPVLTVHTDSDIMSCNYLLIEAWNRYYYIDNITVSSGQRLIIECREDVLMTNHSGLVGKQAFVQRSEKAHQNLYINDQVFLTQNNPMVDYILLSSKAKFATKQGDFTLAIAGGGS